MRTAASWRGRKGRFDIAPKTIARFVLAFAMIWIGVLHFREPDGFAKIVPDYLPAHRALVLWSGFFEVLGGLGLLPKVTRKAASVGLIALYIAVFPANTNMVTHPAPSYSTAFRALLWLRLPLQFALIAWARWVGTDGDVEEA